MTAYVCKKIIGIGGTVIMALFVGPCDFQITCNGMENEQCTE